MTRAIKFRGKNTKGKWVIGDLLRNRGETFIAPPGIANPLAALDDFRVNPATVGQFTGLLDKNGREIYEGDIVKWHDDYPPKRIDWFVCQFDAGNGESSMPLLDLKNHFDLEVIGSIHDNPELLNPKQL